MKKRIFQLLLGSVLSGILLTGCNNNDDNPKTPVTDNDIQNPTNNRIQNPADNKLKDDDNDSLIDNNNLDDDDVNDNDRFRKTNDRNTDTDKDPMKDINTKQEEIIEDDLIETTATDAINKNRGRLSLSLLQS